MARKRSVFISQCEAAQVRRLVLRLGDREVSDLLDLDVLTVTRLAAQLTVSPDTVKRFRKTYSATRRGNKI